MISTFGVKGVQVEELYSLDEETFKQNAPIYGLIFLFKYKSESDTRPTQEAPGLFFAKQVITNACATQAILSVLLNVEQADVDLGPTLSEFKAFISDFSSELKGLAISNSGPIRDSHNSFARAEPFVVEEAKVATDKDDVFHFIAYVPHNGSVYELDGLKAGPIHLGEVDGGASGDWLTVARPAIQARIERYASSEIRFNLMGLVKNKLDVLGEQAAQLDVRKAAVQAALSGDAEAMQAATQEAAGGGGGWALASDNAGLTAQLAECEDQLEECGRKRKAEEEKVASWKMENIRRKHNYIPFVVNLFRMLAERGHLKPMLQEAQSARRE